MKYGKICKTNISSHKHMKENNMQKNSEEVSTEKCLKLTQAELFAGTGGLAKAYTENVAWKETMTRLQEMDRALKGTWSKPFVEHTMKIPSLDFAVESVKASINERNRLLEGVNAFGKMGQVKSFTAGFTEVNGNLGAIIQKTKEEMAFQKGLNVLKELDIGLFLKSIDVAISAGKMISNHFVYSICDEDIDDEEKDEIESTNSIILSEIYQPEKKIVNSDSKIIVMPINDQILKYLSENPQEIYRLSPREFEELMAEIYARHGYNVELTKETRDGGKDIILRKPDIIGDSIYYVECKKHSETNLVGVGIIRNLHSTINVDKVNGGVIATTSYFTKDARKFISENKLNAQIKLHDFNTVQSLLEKTLH